MPVYEYKCKTCGKHFEVTQKITEEPLDRCPTEECKGTVTRLVSRSGRFILNGGGWFKDGY